MLTEILLTAIIIITLVASIIEKEKFHNKYAQQTKDIFKRFDFERESWEKERQMLLERMLYPELNYTTYKAMNKDKPEKKPEPKKELV